ncbi:hypothetical protein BJV82DRAFT_667999 [Fennellomyces sp. T-0311]|nr:hypothetical protein BJV82DRAFT_667999 [Fennellomyces sp. T-0311]
MPPMPHKNAFEPKDPRIINFYEDDDDEDELDDWSLTTTSDVTPRPRRPKKTSTQALVEFLNNTSPEEFEKKAPKRTSTSNLFFLRRNKNKPTTSRPPPSATSSTPTPSSASASYLTSYRPDAPNTIHRKNYIEIIPPPILQREASSSTSLARITSRTPSLASRRSVIRKSVVSNSDQQSPILPTNRSVKQRESSLYSDSIRHSLSTKSHVSNSLRGRPLMRHDTDATRSTGPGMHRRTSEHTFGGQMDPSDMPLAPNQQQLEERERKATEALVSHFASQDDLETVESALLQRLERFRLSKMDKPSDVVAAGLATEHVRALQASVQEYEEQQQQEQHTKKKKIRHMQVQTMPLEPESPSEVSTQTPPQTDPVIPSSDDPVIAQLQQQLADEQKQRKRLEAALEETCDHFEVLSGMAYKKLRELYEDRLRWESSCYELRERLLEMNQGPAPMDDLADFPSSDYVVEEKQDGNGK